MSPANLTPSIENRETRLGMPLRNEFDAQGFDDILKCIHCGLCLDSCPTYRSLGLEQDSPRGRLYMMRGLWEGELKPEPEVMAPLDRCLDCRACQTACPSGVPYGQLLAKTKRVLEPRRRGSKLARILRRVLLGRMFASTKGLVWMSRFGLLYQASGIPRLFRKSRLGGFLSLRFRASHQLMPRFSGSSYKKRLRGQRQEAMGEIENGHVALFSGCVMDVAEQAIHVASLRLLRMAGYAVTVPLNQQCCGALQEHAGEHGAATALAETNIEAFGQGNFDAVVINAAGCSAQLKAYKGLETKNLQRATAFATKCVDLLEWLARDLNWIKQQKWRSEPVTVLYDAPCHLIHAQGIDRQPLSLLGRIPGIHLVTLEDYQECCGAAGIYNLVQPQLAADIGGRKIAAIERTLERVPEASVLVTANPGCLFQIRSGVESRALPIRVLHPAVFLSERVRGT